MSYEAHAAKTGPSGTLLEPPPVGENPAGFLSNSLWRCRNCGAIDLGGPESKPEPCAACGATRPELLDE